MKTVLALSFCLLASGAMAQQPTDDEITAAYNTCMLHRTIGLPRGWEAGWEQCAQVVSAYETTSQARFKAAEQARKTAAEQQAKDVMSRLK